MPKRFSYLTKNNLEKCRAAAIAAVDSYNRPGPRFRTALYVVLIIIAWQAFFHAYFYNHNQNPWFQSRNSKHKKGVRYEKIDGEPKHWDLSACLKKFFNERHLPERKNLEFLLGLRNKIEHRHLPELDSSLYGECQAALLNLEKYLTREFGKQYGLEETLSVSLQFSFIRPPEQQKAFKSLAKGVGTVLEYIKEFRGGLSDDQLNHPGYAYRVFLVPKIANRESAADSAIEFVHFDQANKEQKENLEKMNVLIKDRKIPIANLDLHKPTEIVKRVSHHLLYAFNMHHHTKARKYFNVRPTSNSKNPEETNSSYCVYDKAHNDYLYTQVWVEKLTVELSDPSNFQKITGCYPKMK